jgi:hypothetical protein
VCSVGPLYSHISVYLGQAELLPSTVATYLRSTVTMLTCHSIRYALFWDIMHCRMVIPYWRFGTTYRSHLQASRSLSSCTSSCTSWPLKMELISCPEISVRNYHSARRNISEERGSCVQRCGSLKSVTLCLCSKSTTLFVGIYFSYNEWREWENLKTKEGFSESNTANSKDG